jgi:hypothetical protein
MGLAEDLATVDRPRCAFGRWLDSAPNDDRVAVLDYIGQIHEKRKLQPRGTGPSVQRLTDTLNANGVQLGIRVTQMHVNGSCRCEDDYGTG